MEVVANLSSVQTPPNPANPCFLNESAHDSLRCYRFNQERSCYTNQSIYIVWLTVNGWLLYVSIITCIPPPDTAMRTRGNMGNLSTGCILHCAMRSYPSRKLCARVTGWELGAFVPCAETGPEIGNCSWPRRGHHRSRTISRRHILRETLKCSDFG